MIDYITLTATNLPDDYAEAFKNEAGGRFNSLGAETYHDMTVRTMYLHLAYSKKQGWVLNIKGSVKDFKNGENYSFMDFAQTTDALQELAALVGLAPTQLSVTSLEVSAPVATAPIENLVSGYGKWAFMPKLVPKKKSGFGGKSYGVMATSPHPYVSIKIYRKNDEQQIRYGRKLPQLQQVEFCIDKPRFLRDKLKRAGIPSDSPLTGGVALSDLMKPEVQHILCDLLADIPNQITLKEDAMASIDYDAILLSDLLANEKSSKKREAKLLELLSFAESRSFRQRLKTTRKDHYYKLKAEFTPLRDQLCPSSDKELRRFQEALQAAVKAGRPTEVSPITYVGKMSEKKTKTTSLVNE